MQTLPQQAEKRGKLLSKVVHELLLMFGVLSSCCFIKLALLQATRVRTYARHSPVSADSSSDNKD
eukprot:280484-Amorphochlora_amoeboformis.AAC.2